jgi:hypothetical protein
VLAFDTAMVAHVVPRRSEPDGIGVSLDGAAPPDCRPRWRGRRLSSMPALMTVPNLPLRLRDPDVSLPLVRRGLEYRWHVYKLLKETRILGQIVGLCGGERGRLNRVRLRDGRTEPGLGLCNLLAISGSELCLPLIESTQPESNSDMLRDS